MSLLRQVRPGEALLLHNTLPPAHLFGRYWFRDARLHLAATETALPGRAGWRRRLAERLSPAAAHAEPAHGTGATGEAGESADLQADQAAPLTVLASATADEGAP
jgi:type IV secretion system protein VirD4